MYTQNILWPNILLILFVAFSKIERTRDRRTGGKEQLGENQRKLLISNEGRCGDVDNVHALVCASELLCLYVWVRVRVFKAICKQTMLTLSQLMLVLIENQTVQTFSQHWPNCNSQIVYFWRKRDWQKRGTLSLQQFSCMRFIRISAEFHSEKEPNLQKKKISSQETLITNSEHFNSRTEFHRIVARN